MKDLIIRKMNLDDLEFAVELAAKEGWNPGLNDTLPFFNTDPNGYFIAEINGESVGAISAVAYNETYGFIGFYIVKNEYRGRIIGLQLGRKAMEYLGDRNIGIDGVLNKVKNYEAFGFKFAYQNARYQGISKKNNIDDLRLVDISKIEFDKLLEFDNLFFPVARPVFLKNWFAMPESYGCAYLENNKIGGYGIIRKCRVGYKIGPLFANNYAIADLIFNGLISKIEELEKIYLDIPEINDAAVKLVENYKMTKVFSTARMYNKFIPELPVDKIFGVTSFELG